MSKFVRLAPADRVDAQKMAIHDAYRFAEHMAALIFYTKTGGRTIREK